MHLDVTSPLCQSRSGTVARGHVEGSLGCLKDFQDPFVEENYRKHANGNPLATVVLERVLENRGTLPKLYEELPETTKENSPQ